MKFLAWDTSSKAGSIVAMDSEKVIAELSLNVDSTHSERLLWGIHQVLEAARWKLEDVDVFGVGVGPGSFTGLRIGVTTARTLAHTLHKPLVGVSSLAILARPIADIFSKTGRGKETLVVAVTDACKGELFSLWGTADQLSYDSSSDLLPNTLTHSLRDSLQASFHEEVHEAPVLLQRLGELFKTLGPNAAWIAIGEGRKRYAEDWSHGLPLERELSSLFPLYNQIEGRYLGRLVLEAFNRGEYKTEALDVQPRYLRASSAELKLRSSLH